MRKGFLFVISGPSAVGKTSVTDEILKTDTSLSRVITCTTRPIRESEQNGVDYFFMTKSEFLSHKDRGDFIEFSEVYGNYYGVMLSTIEEKINKGVDTLLVINWEGFSKVKTILKENIYGFFITPPSMQDLEIRIRSRNSDSEEVIKHRLEIAYEDMKHIGIFDTLVENRDIKETAQSVLKHINSIRNL